MIKLEFTIDRFVLHKSGYNVIRVYNYLNVFNNVTSYYITDGMKNEMNDVHHLLLHRFQYIQYLFI